MARSESSASGGAELVRLLVGHVFLHSAMTGLRLSAPLWVLSHGYSKASAGVVMALFAFSQIFLALPAGRLADRRGLKVTVGLAVIGATLATAVAALWPVLPIVCLSAAVTGAAVGAATIAMQRHVGRAAETPEQLRRMFSWFTLAPAASNFLGPLAAGLAIDAFGFRAAFLLLAVLALSSWLWTRTAHEIPAEVAATGRAGTAWSLWRDAGFRRLMLVNWFFTASWDVQGFMVPVLGHERGLPASVIGSILGAFAIAAACIRVLLPALAARVREWVMITGAIAASGALFICYPFASSGLQMGVLSALLGVTLGSVQPMILSMLHQITPDGRHGQSVAMRIMMNNTSGTLMPLLFGTAGAALGAAGVLWAMGTIVGLGSLVAVTLRRHQRS